MEMKYHFEWDSAYTLELKTQQFKAYVSDYFIFEMVGQFIAENICVIS